MEKRERNRITNLESLTLGNCNITLTLDTRYKDENGIDECYLDMLYRKKDKRWYLNDITNDIISTSAYWKGKMGYIIEFDDNKVSN